MRRGLRWRQVLVGVTLAIFPVANLLAKLYAVVVDVIPLDPQKGCVIVIVDIYDDRGTTNPTDDVYRGTGAILTKECGPQVAHAGGSNASLGSSILMGVPVRLTPAVVKLGGGVQSVMVDYLGRKYNEGWLVNVNNPQIRHELRGMRFEGREELRLPSGLPAGHYMVVFLGSENVGIGRLVVVE